MPLLKSVFNELFENIDKIECQLTDKALNTLSSTMLLLLTQRSPFIKITVFLHRIIRHSSNRLKLGQKCPSNRTALKEYSEKIFRNHYAFSSILLYDLLFLTFDYLLYKLSSPDDSLNSRRHSVCSVSLHLQIKSMNTADFIQVHSSRCSLNQI